jgi:hypothetical protein
VMIALSSMLDPRPLNDTVLPLIVVETGVVEIGFVTSALRGCD